MTTKVATLERKQKSWSEDSPTGDSRILNDFIRDNPNAEITTVFHSGVKHLIIIYKERAN